MVGEREILASVVAVKLYSIAEMIQKENKSQGASKDEKDKKRAKIQVMVLH